MTSEPTVDIEITDGGAYITIGERTINLSLDYPALDDQRAVQANLHAVVGILDRLYAALPDAIVETRRQIAEVRIPCEHCGGTGVEEPDEHHPQAGREFPCRECVGTGAE